MTTFPLNMANIFTPSFSYPMVAAQTTRLSRTRCHIEASTHSLARPHKNELVHVAKVENIKQRMKNFPECSLEELEMIDAIQRLGIDYLFHQEIGDALQMHNTRFCYLSATHHYCGGHELHEVALRFRLLRQSGYNVSSDHTLNKFKDGDGKFMPKISEDVQGVMSLFEASQLGIQGEDTLDEANTFSIQIINSFIGGETMDGSNTTLENQHQPSHIRLVLRTLKNPHHKSLARLNANELLIELSNKKGWKFELAELAKMEYDEAKILYKNEATSVSLWWDTLDLAKESKFARYQPLKWYIWTLALIQDPKLSHQRIQLSKPISLVYFIDDIFDVYGTIDQLCLFTEAVERWNFGSIEKLPKIMKVCLKALFATTTELSQQIYVKYGWNPEKSLQKAWADLFHAFLVEFKWLTSGSMPTSEEYLNVGRITTGIPLVLMHLQCLLGIKNDDSSSQIFSENSHRIIYSVSTILRLWDDLGSAQDEDIGGKDGSYLLCYMNENNGVSVADARKHIHDLILEEWKGINKDSLFLLHQDPKSSSNTFISGCLNMARTIPLMYNYDDDHNLPQLENLIGSLFFKNNI